MSAEMMETNEGFIPVVIEPLPDDAPEWADVLNTNIGALASGVNQMNSAMADVRGIVKAVQMQVGPTIDALANHPMFKMLGMGKGK